MRTAVEPAKSVGWAKRNTASCGRAGWLLVASVAVAIGVALLTKESVYFLAPLVLITLIVGLRRSIVGKSIAVLVAIPLVITGWWFIRSLLTYGSLTPPLSPLFPHSTLQVPSQLAYWSLTSFASFVGLFGGMTTPIQLGGHSTIIYGAVLCAMFLILATAIFAVLTLWRAWRRTQRRLTVFLASVALIALMQMLAYSLLVDYQAQGRYLFVALPVLGLSAALSLYFVASRVSARWLRLATVVGLVGMTILDYAGISTVQGHLVLT